MSPSSIKSCAKRFWPALLCGLAGFGIFSAYGNANHGYIDTSSLFVWWVRQWIEPASELQHAWILLVLSLWIFWRNLKASPPDNAGRPALATVCLCGALLLHGLAFQMQQARFSIFALLLFIYGLLGLAGGRRWARASVFPLSLMIFAIPLGFLDSAGFWMRLSVVDASHALARLAGLDVLRSGTQLFSAKGGFQYDVAAACSGIRSLQALLALSLVAGYLQLRSPLGRLLAFLLSLPLVYAGNVLRIGVIIFAGAWAGQNAGTRVHNASGFIVFAVVLGVLLLCLAWIKRLKPAWAALEVEAGPKPEIPPFSFSPRVQIRSCAIVVAFSLIVGLSLAWRETHVQPPRAGICLSPDGLNPVELPTFIGTAWIGKSQSPTAIERQILPPDTGYSRKLYLSLEKPGRSVFFSVVLSGRDRSSIHRPELCLVGQGWSIQSRTLHRFSLPGAKGSGFETSLLHVNRQIPGRAGSSPELVCYWFIGADSMVATQVQHNWQDGLSRLKGHAGRWAYVLLQTDARDGEAAACARLQEIMDGTLPVLLSH